MGYRNGFQKDTTPYWTSHGGSLEWLDEQLSRNQNIRQIFEEITLNTPQYAELLKTGFIILIKSSIFPNLGEINAEDAIEKTAKAEFLINSPKEEIKALQEFGRMVELHTPLNDLFIKMTDEPVAINAAEHKILYDTMSTIARKTLALAETSPQRRALQALTILLKKMVPFFREDRSVRKTFCHRDR